MLICWAEKQGKAQADNEGSNICDRGPGTVLFPISWQMFQPLQVGLQGVPEGQLQNKYNIQSMYNIPQQPLALSKAGQTLVLRNTLKSARHRTKAFTSDNYGRNFAKENLQEDSENM